MPTIHPPVDYVKGIDATRHVEADTPWGPC
jgi:hypothetical protein